jgi:hypothetical protein
MDKFVVKNANINIGLDLLINSEKSKQNLGNSNNIHNHRIMIGEDTNKNKLDIEKSLSIFKNRVIERIDAYHPTNKKDDIIDYYIDSLWYKILFESIDSSLLKDIYDIIEKTKK